MKNLFLILIIIAFLSSCASRNQLVYINDSDLSTIKIIDHSKFKNYIEVGDILNIKVSAVVAEAAIPYNKISTNSLSAQNFDYLKLEGYLVNEFKIINFPVLGQISVENMNVHELENKITHLLKHGGHLASPSVKVSIINYKFTILGEVKNPGTFSYYDEKINIFQALGYAGDLTINGKREDIKLIRENNGLRKIYKISLSESNLLNKPYYFIKNNDVIIIAPNFSKVKSSGFIGSASSIASISSLIVSITLLLLNNIN